VNSQILLLLDILSEQVHKCERIMLTYQFSDVCKADMSAYNEFLGVRSDTQIWLCYVFLNLLPSAKKYCFDIDNQF
jgi:hypothetical protein